jgi:cell division septum initiation protein DivIVA
MVGNGRAQGGRAPGAGLQQGVQGGSRNPVWGCGCGEAANWASRAKCRQCGRDAPTSILNRAKQDRAKQEKGAWGAWGRTAGGAGGAGNKEVADLRKQLLALQKKFATVAPESEPMDSDAKVYDLGGAHQALAGLRAAGLEHLPSFAALSKDIDAEKRKRAESKPLSQQAKTLEARISKKRKAQGVAADKVQAARDILAKKADELLEAQRAEKQVHDELAELEVERLVLCQRMVVDVEALPSQVGNQAQQVEQQLEGDAEALAAWKLVQNRLREQADRATEAAEAAKVDERARASAPSTASDFLDTEEATGLPGSFSNEELEALLPGQSADEKRSWLHSWATVAAKRRRQSQ